MFDAKDLVELEELRTEFTKTYRPLGDDLGKRVLVSTTDTRPLHIRQRDEWVNVHTKLSADGKINNGIYDAELLPNRLGYKGTDKNGRELEIWMEGTYVEPEIDGKTVVYRDVLKDTDLVMEFTRKDIKMVRVLKTAKAPKEVKFHSLHDRGLPPLRNVGIDSAGKSALLTINSGDGWITSKFDGKVLHIDSKTRLREWVEPTYPVFVDPTTTFEIADRPTSMTSNTQSQEAGMLYATTGSSSTVGGHNSNSVSWYVPSDRIASSTPWWAPFDMVGLLPLIDRYSSATGSTFNTTATIYNPNSTSPTSTSYAGSTVVTSNFWSSKVKSGFRFPVSGLLTGDTINSATVRLALSRVSGAGQSTRAVAVFGDHRDDALSTNNPKLSSTSGRRTSLLSANPASSAQQTVSSHTVTATHSNYALSSTTDLDTISHQLRDFDVTSYVQLRVDNFDYDPGAFLFGAKMTTSLSINTSISIGSVSIVVKGRATSDEPLLIIDYTSAGGGGPSTYKPKIIFA